MIELLDVEADEFVNAQARAEEECEDRQRSVMVGTACGLLEQDGEFARGRDVRVPPVRPLEREGSRRVRAPVRDEECA